MKYSTNRPLGPTLVMPSVCFFTVFDCLVTFVVVYTTNATSQPRLAFDEPVSLTFNGYHRGVDEYLCKLLSRAPRLDPLYADPPERILLKHQSHATLPRHFSKRFARNGDVFVRKLPGFDRFNSANLVLAACTQSFG
jgi:hypothetical protein